jgi:hypothetical protein
MRKACASGPKRIGSDNQSVERRLPSGKWVLINEHRTANNETVISTPMSRR